MAKGETIKEFYDEKISLFNDPNNMIIKVPSYILSEFMKDGFTYSFSMNPSKDCFTIQKLDSEHGSGRDCMLIYGKSHKVKIIHKEKYLHKEKRGKDANSH